MCLLGVFFLFSFSGLPHVHLTRWWFIAVMLKCSVCIVYVHPSPFILTHLKKNCYCYWPTIFSRQTCLRKFNLAETLKFILPSPTVESMSLQVIMPFIFHAGIQRWFFLSKIYMYTFSHWVFLFIDCLRKNRTFSFW